MTADADQGLMGFTSDAAAPAPVPAAGIDPMSMTGGSDPLSFVGGEAAPAPAVDTSYQDPFAGMPNSSGMGKAIPDMTPLREWQDKHEQELEEITKKEQESKQATRATAAEELGKWYEERKDTISKKASSNRKEEVAAEEARQAALKPGANAWERVVDLIDTNA